MGRDDAEDVPDAGGANVAGDPRGRGLHGSALNPAAPACGREPASVRLRSQSGDSGHSCGLTPEIMRVLNFHSLAERCRETELRQLRTARHLSDLFALSGEAVFLVDGHWRIVDLNPGAERAFALGRDALGRPLTDLLPGFVPPANEVNPVENVTTSARRADGGTFPARVCVAGDRALGVWTVLVTDLDEGRLAERELAAAENLVLAVNGADSIEAALGEALRGMRELIGWEAAEAWLPDAEGEHLYAGGSHLMRSSDDALFLAGNRLPLRSGEGLPGRAWNSGRPEWMESLPQACDFRCRDAAVRTDHRTGLAVPIFVGGEFIAVLCFYTRRTLGADERLIRVSAAIAGHLGTILQRKRVEDRLHYLAHHDPLTGAANRALLRERIDHARMEANRRGRFFALLHLDLDRFKSINDVFGYPAGDRLLQQVAERLREAVRGSDTVARLGSDEFMLLLTGLKQVDNVAGIAEKIAHCFARPFALAGQQATLSASMGITIYPHDAMDTDGLLQNADIAMNRAKEQDGGYRFHTEEMSVHFRERMSLERDLRLALSREEFSLRYQPIFDLASGAFTHVETLARWSHPQRGEVSPSVFIPLAEKTGMIVEFGEWVLRTACRQAAEWQRCGRVPAPHVAVNISARELGHQQFVERLRDVLVETGCDPAGLTIEITESLFIDVDMIDVLRAVSATGVQLSIDDFGTGYSSLAYLRRLQLDYLKIDRSFINDVPHDAEATILVTAIIDMAHALGLKVVAEGIETEAQLRYLMEQGCDLVQGYYLGVPMPAKEAARLFRARPRGVQDPLMNGIRANQPM